MISIKRLLAEPSTRGIELDSAKAAVAHRDLILRKPVLRRIYEEYYRQFFEAEKRAPKGLRVEFGSGGGFLEEYIEGLVKTDIREGVRVDIAASALEMPFRDRTVGAVFMLNVLHHLPNVEEFFLELERVLVPDGRCILIEPFVSPLSKVIYRYLHHEPFDPDRAGWRFESSGAMTGANDALPWMVFVRDRALFEEKFDGLRIVGVSPHTVLTYLLSGGLSYRSILPVAFLKSLLGIEKRLGGLNRLLASMMTVEIAMKR